MKYTRVDLSKYIVISIWFGCNNNCTICMLSGLKRQLPAISFDNYKRVLSGIRDEGRFENLILSGAEVTTFEHLDRFVQYAASLEYFKKIQIQTNGRRLKDKAYLKHLIDCGVNEFFVSIHGLDDVHDAICRTKGAFKETKEGLLNLAEYDVNVITNTVFTKTNFQGIPRLAAFLAQGKASEIHLWNYFPMERTDSKDLVVSMKDFVALLPEVLSVGKTAGKAIVLKSFPECLSTMGPPEFFDSLYPVTLLPDRFWREFSECGFGQCVYRDRCKAMECWGLSSAYIHKYGDEKHLLSPFI
jgi:MoaA/NifB/PqqE/SkfB family radical SAM enzyme